MGLENEVDRIRPSVEGLLATEVREDLDALVREAVRANVRALGAGCADAGAVSGR